MQHKIRLTSDEETALEAVSRDRRVTFSEAVRIAIRAGLRVIQRGEDESGPKTDPPPAHAELVGGAGPHRKPNF